MPGYFQELRTQWRPLTAAIIGMSSGYSITNYVTSIMAPHMLKEFGWTAADFATVGSLGMLSTLVFPFIGRLADTIGVRWTALIGVLAFPLAYTALSLQPGSLSFYIGLYIVMGFICVTTTATVYSRLVVQYVAEARGLALAIVASGPAVMGVVFAPLLNLFVESHGWRTGYIAMAVFSAVAGAAALLMIPKRDSNVGERVTRRPAREDYPAILRNRAFWILAASMLLCNLPQVISLTQLNLVLLSNGVSATGVSAMISAFAVGTLSGRFICGVCLDRFSPNVVAFVGMALASVGLMLIASSIDATWVLMISIALFGLSIGAEGDLISYLVMRAFGVQVYSSVMGLMTAIISIAIAGGALLLGLMLKGGGSYVPFLSLCAGTVLLGAFLLLFVPSSGSPGSGSID